MTKQFAGDVDDAKSFWIEGFNEVHALSVVIGVFASVLAASREK